jgi:hypothetical protein
MERAHERILGTILVALGVALLLFAFLHAFSLLGQVPSASSSSEPQAAFSWTVNGYNLTVTDQSRAGSSPITSTYWTFGDGGSSSSQNTTHLYATKPAGFNISLTVEDKNGNVEQSNATIRVGNGATSSGVGSPSLPPGGGLGSILGGKLGGSLSGIASIAESFILLLVMWMVGASILKAGWNLITPKAETIQVRVKPKSLQVEAAGDSVMPPSAPAPPPLAPPGASGGPGTGGPST